MSKENLEQFMSKVADSEELQARIGEEIDTEALIALGAECGCEFTAEAIAEYAELSDEELDGVAGGVRSSLLNTRMSTAFGISTNLGTPGIGGAKDLGGLNLNRKG